MQCGWLKDKYGVSWQIVPSAWEKIIQGAPPEKSERAMKALLKMKKIDMETLRKASA